jgi:hypothetical protein
VHADGDDIFIFQRGAYVKGDRTIRPFAFAERLFVEKGGGAVIGPRDEQTNDAILGCGALEAAAVPPLAFFPIVGQGAAGRFVGLFYGCRKGNRKPFGTAGIMGGPGGVYLSRGVTAQFPLQVMKVDALRHLWKTPSAFFQRVA